LPGITQRRGWKPIVWTEEERKKGQAWGLKTIESFHTHGTPPV
jgi:catechol 2,3-dioxygenase